MKTADTEAMLPLLARSQVSMVRLHSFILTFKGYNSQTTNSQKLVTQGENLGQTSYLGLAIHFEVWRPPLLLQIQKSITSKSRMDLNGHGPATFKRI